MAKKVLLQLYTDMSLSENVLVILFNVYMCIAIPVMFFHLMTFLFSNVHFNMYEIGALLLPVLFVSKFFEYMQIMRLILG